MAQWFGPRFGSKLLFGASSSAPEHSAAFSGMDCGDDKRVFTTADELREINEDARIMRRVAGLREWPEYLFVIGKDGSGNYYAIRHDEEEAPVVIFDQEQDELRQVAPSFELFCKRIESGLPLDHRVLRKGPRTAAKPTPSVVVPDLSRRPEWTRSWSSFVETYAAMPERDGRNPEQISKVNARFGSRVARWASCNALTSA